jgi:tetratricopeptide (TPR) repeat protein
VNKEGAVLFSALAKRNSPPKKIMSTMFRCFGTMCLKNLKSVARKESPNVNSNKKYFILVLILFGSVFLFSQNRKIDSLLRVLRTQPNDTNRIFTLNALSWEIKNNNPDSSLVVAGEALKLAGEFFEKGKGKEKTTGRRGMANVYLNSGWYNYMLGDFRNGLKNTGKALAIYTEINNRTGEAKAYGNMGSIFYNQGDYLQALDNFFKSLKINESLLNSADKKTIFQVKSRIANDLGNIGNVYYSEGEMEKSLEFYFKALKIDSAVSNDVGVARHLGNIGSVYCDLGDITKSLEFDFRSLKTKEKAGYKNGIAKQLLNIGINYRLRGDSAIEKGNILYANTNGYEKANEYFDKGLKIAEEVGDKNVIAAVFSGRGLVQLKLKKHKEAEQFLLKALAIDTVIGSMEGIKTENQTLSTLYSETGQFEKAFYHYKVFTRAKDSLFNEEKNKEITRKEMKYEFEKKEAETKAAQEKKSEADEVEKRKQKMILYIISTGLIIVLLLAAIIFRSLKLNQKKNKIITEQKKLVEKQKDLVEEKQKEILDSIRYAKRIQTALIASEKYIERNLSKLQRK